MSELKIRIDWSELDLYGHVNNVMIFKYIQAARIQYCEKIGLGTLNEPGKPGFILAATGVVYKKKVLYPGELRVESHVQWIKTTSFRIDHVIYNTANEPLVEAYDVIVVYDYEKDGKAEVAQAQRDAIDREENRKVGNAPGIEAGQYPDIE